MALTQITFFPVLGIPLVAWLGAVTYMGFLGTALIPIIRKRGRKVPFQWHVRLAYFSVIMATIHGSLALAAYL